MHVLYPGTVLSPVLCLDVRIKHGELKEPSNAYDMQVA